MLFSNFNQAPAHQIQALLKHCVHIDVWGTCIIQQRPFNDRHALITYAKQLAQSWTWEDILAALNTHPRIGEKKAQAQLSTQEQEFSDREQAALHPDQETLDALYAGNLAYEKKFGFIFLIKASGLDSQHILTALNFRLVNDLESEKRIVHQQLSEIALLRLAQEIQA